MIIIINIGANTIMKIGAKYDDWMSGGGLVMAWVSSVIFHV